MFALLAVAVAGSPASSADFAKSMMAKFHEPRAVQEALKARSAGDPHDKHDKLALVTATATSDASATLSVKIMHDIGSAEKQISRELKDQPDLRREEEDLLRRPMDKAHAAADLTVAARKTAHKTVALAQSQAKAKVEATAKSAAELQVEANRALNKYVSGMKREVKNEKALLKETKYAESAVAQLSIPDAEKAAAAKALEEVQAIEKREVVAAKHAVSAAKKLRGKK